MPFRIKVSLIIVALLLALVFVVPLVVPIPAPQGARPLAEVAQGAELVEVSGVGLHVARYPHEGAAPAPTFVLLHDYAFWSYAFEPIAPALAAHGAVVAFDRPGFGLSERPLPEGDRYAVGFDPYTPEAQVALAVGLLDALGVEQAVLVGNGMGGRVALDTALAHPERVRALVLLDTPVSLEETARAAPGWLLNSPQMRRLGPVFLRQLAEGPGEQLLLGAFADEGAVTPEIRARHAVTTSVEGWDRALWEVSRAGRPASLAGRLGALAVPTLVVAGEADATVPLSDAERLVSELPDAELVTLPECGRVPQLECPEPLMQALEAWLQRTGLAATL